MMIRKHVKHTILVIFLLFMTHFDLSAYDTSQNGENIHENGYDDSGVPGLLCAKMPGSNKNMFLPLKQTDVHLDITAGIVSANVLQQFKNDTDYPLEAVYVFPLPSRATITDMILKIGDRTIVSVVKERAEAKKTYEKAKKKGKKTALLEQERPNIFTTSVANLMPGDTAKISFSYMEKAEYQKGIYSISFPMVVGQRYIPFKIEKHEDNTLKLSSPVKDAHRINPPLLHPSIAPEHKLTLIADINGMPVKEIISNTHAIHIEKSEYDPEKLRVTLAGKDTLPDSDFNMKLILKDNESPGISFLHSLKENTSYGLLTVFPPKNRKKSKTGSIPRDVIFLIDTSGSMSGESISQAKEGLRQCLSMLRKKDSFTIVRFANNFSYFSPSLRPAKPTTVKAAEGYIRGLAADGGTEMQKALKYVLSVPGNEGAMKMIVFLTDGDVGNETSLMRLLDRELGHGRLFTFGIGSAPNEYLMRKMAEIGRGQSRFIRSHEDIGTVMSDFFRTLDAPVLTDIEISWKDFKGQENKSINFYPNPCPDVFHDRPLQVFAEFPSGFTGKMVLSGLFDGEPVTYTYPVNGSNSQHFPAIDKMFGKAIINDLMYKLLRADSENTRSTIRKKVIETAMHHNLVSKFTSRVAVEEKIVRRPDQTLVSVKVPVHLPKGWNPAQFYSTATDNAMQFVIGFLIFFLGFFACIIRITLKNWNLHE